MTQFSSTLWWGAWLILLSSAEEAPEATDFIEQWKTSSISAGEKYDAVVSQRREKYTHTTHPLVLLLLDLTETLFLLP